MIRVNIYNSWNQLVEERKAFHSWGKAEAYTKYICPKLYGAGRYYFVICK